MNEQAFTDGDLSILMDEIAALPGAETIEGHGHKGVIVGQTVALLDPDGHVSVHVHPRGDARECWDELVGHLTSPAPILTPEEQLAAIFGAPVVTAESGGSGFMVV